MTMFIEKTKGRFLDSFYNNTIASPI